MDKKEYQKAYHRQYYQRNKKDIDAKVRAWKKAHPEKEVEYNRKFRKLHKEKLSQKTKVRRQEKWEEIRSQETKSREKSARNFLVRKLSNIKKGKRKYQSDTKEYKKTFDFDIDLDYLLGILEKQDGRCAITGYTMLHKFSNPYSISIDRIDSSQGYVRGNIQLVCQTINFAKNSWSNEIMMEFWNNIKQPLKSNPDFLS